MRSSTVPSSSQKTTNVVVGTVDKTDFSPSDIVAGDREVVASAVTPPKPGDKQLRWYRVTKGAIVDKDGRISLAHDGMRTRIDVGKQLNDGAYDINLLRRQGIELEDLGEGPATGPLQATG